MRCAFLVLRPKTLPSLSPRCCATRKRLAGKPTRKIAAGRQAAEILLDPGRPYARVCAEAKRHGLLFVPMRDRNDPELIETAIWAEDSAKVERSHRPDAAGLVETGEREIMSDVTPEQPAPGQERPERQPVQGADDVSIPFGLDDPDGGLGFTQPAPLSAELEDPAFSRSTRTTVPRSCRPPPAKTDRPIFLPRCAPRRHGQGGERPSVREELRGIKAMLHATEAMTPKPKVPIPIIAATAPAEPEVFRLFSFGI